MEKSPLLLKNVVHNGHTCDILIENGVFRRIDSCIIPSAECRVIDFKGNFAISPAFYNTHTHAAMSIFRGYKDDRNVEPFVRNRLIYIKQLNILIKQQIKTTYNDKLENIINNVIYLGLPKRISFLDASDKEGKPEEVTL